MLDVVQWGRRRLERLVLIKSKPPSILLFSLPPPFDAEVRNKRDVGGQGGTKVGGGISISARARVP